MSEPRYVSTRASDAAPIPFAEALLRGLAPNGGLYVPTHVPPLAGGWRAASSFAGLGAHVLRPWLSDTVGAQALGSLVNEALCFPVPLVPLRSGGWDGVYVLELFHGPTLSFKDFGARAMARLMRRILRTRGERVTVLVATSGDTGSAVADGFAGLPGLRVVLLYPEGQVSPVQEQQLIAARPGVQALAVRGTFDACQRLVKAAFGDARFAPLGLSSANSINVGRLLPQMLYYVWAVKEGGFDRMVFCVPSGNLGNLTGGVLARKGGLPVHCFLAAHNANDAFPRFLGGEDDPFGDSRRTLSNAMDVGAPSNFERLRSILGTDAMRRLVRPASVSDEDTLTRMRSVYETTGYVADPHTAVGLEAARRYREATGESLPVVVLSTAHPAKFPAVVERALGRRPDVPEALAALDDTPTAVRAIDPTLDALHRAVTASPGGTDG